MKSPFTIGFDLTWMNVENKSGGIYQYAQRIISALLHHTDCNIVAIHSATGVGALEHLADQDNFKAVLVDSSCLFSDLIEGEGIDIIHTPIQQLINVTALVPMVHTLHDLQHLHYPEFFAEREIEFRDIIYRKSAEFCERVIVSFLHVKEDLMNLWGLPEDKIDVCTPGIDEPSPVEQDRFQEMRENYNVPEKYLFYPANTWRHKNHLGLIRALKLCHDRYDAKISLVCTGHQYEDFFPEILKAVKDLDLEDYVHFIGYIPEKDVHLLLANAALVVVPTFYEAGSFALMEAMSYGIPVICSNVTSLPSTIGDERFLFDPNDTDDMARKIALMLKDESLRQYNRDNSLKRLRENSWDRSARLLLESYEKAIESFNREKGERYYTDKLLNYEHFINIKFHRFNEILTERDRYLSELKDQTRRLQDLITERNRYLSDIKMQTEKINNLTWERNRYLSDLLKQNNKVEELVKENQDLEKENNDQLKQLSQLKQFSGNMQQKVKTLESQNKRIKNSLSWKITRPLREVGEAIRRSKKR